jgi:predicted transposase/invertase (TIGR01784 family)
MANLDIKKPHDKFFRELFGQPELAADFLQHYLPPEVVARLDLSRLELAHDSFVDADLQEHLSDLLYRVGLAGSPRSALLYFLFEHKSFSDEWVALQLLRYKVRRWEQAQNEGAETLPPIIPIVVYHGPTKWKAARNFSSLIDLEHAPELRIYQADFTYHLCDLSALSDDNIKGHAALRAGLSLLKYIFSDELWPRLAGLFELYKLLPEQSALEYLRTAMIYLSATTKETEVPRIRQALAQAFPVNEGGFMRTMAQAWIEEGQVKGRSEGLVEGQQKGIAFSTIKLLKNRFADLDDETLQMVERLPLAQLEVFFDTALGFQAVEQVHDWLRQHGVQN